MSLSPEFKCLKNMLCSIISQVPKAQKSLESTAITAITPTFRLLVPLIWVVTVDILIHDWPNISFQSWAPTLIIEYGASLKFY